MDRAQAAADQRRALRRYARVADALVTAYASSEPAAMRVVWDYFGHRRAWDGMRRYVRLDLGRTEQPLPGETDAITLVEARYLVARAQGFESWDALAAHAAATSPGAMPRRAQSGSTRPATSIPPRSPRGRTTGTRRSPSSVSAACPVSTPAAR